MADRRVSQHAHGEGIETEADRPGPASRWPSSARDWALFLIGLGLVSFLFDTLARFLGSDRGQAGLVVGALVVIACLILERVLRGEPPRRAWRSLGLGVPRGRGLLAAIVCGLLLLVAVVYLRVTKTAVAEYPGWAGLLPGLFAQAGIAEETLFRGYLFRHIRQGRSFWNASFVASGPFVLVHLLLFATLPWMIALASVVLAAVIAVPLACLFERAGNTIWAPALVHWTVQSVPKLIVIDDAAGFALVWMAASAIIPFAAFVTWRK